MVSLKGLRESGGELGRRICMRACVWKGQREKVHASGAAGNHLASRWMMTAATLAYPAAKAMAALQLMSAYHKAS